VKDRELLTPVGEAEGTVMTGGVLFLAAFLACVVEAVEATTVVLAVGVTRGWGSSLRGTFAALVVLGAVVAAVGPAISSLPLNPLRLVVGALLLIFGLGWLRKAILRASGFKALHDEEELYRKELQAARAAASSGRSWLGGDSYGFTLAFKAVVLEGLEVAFIVVTFGANAKDVPLAAAAAGAAVVLVLGVAIIVRGPLSKVPENWIKFGVGILLTSFGTFWGAEGAGASWPGSDGSLLVMIPLVAVLAGTLVTVLRRRHQLMTASHTAKAGAQAAAS
jgi:uncharacterized membrane protein